MLLDDPDAFKVSLHPKDTYDLTNLAAGHDVPIERVLSAALAWGVAALKRNPLMLDAVLTALRQPTDERRDVRVAHPRV